MILRLAAVAALGAFSTGAFAADLRDTHVEVRMPAGKGLMPVYKPVAQPKVAQKPAFLPGGKIAIHEVHVEPRQELAEK